MLQAGSLAATAAEVAAKVAEAAVWVNLRSEFLSLNVLIRDADVGGFLKLGVPFKILGGPNGKDYSILGSILGSP